MNCSRIFRASGRAGGVFRALAAASRAWRAARRGRPSATAPRVTSRRSAARRPAGTDRRVSRVPLAGHACAPCSGVGCGQTTGPADGTPDGKSCIWGTLKGIRRLRQRKSEDAHLRRLPRLARRPAASEHGGEPIIACACNSAVLVRTGSRPPGAGGASLRVTLRRRRARPPAGTDRGVFARARLARSGVGVFSQRSPPLQPSPRWTRSPVRTRTEFHSGPARISCFVFYYVVFY